MAVYQFKGVTAEGKNVSGIRNADSVRTLQSLLRKEGIFPTEINQQADDRAKAAGEIDIKRFTKGVSTRELAVVTRQLATLLHAGVTLVESLTAVF